MKTNNKNWIIINFGCIYFIWGSTYLVVKSALYSFSPFQLIFMRLACASFLLFLIALLAKEKTPTKTQIYNSIGLGILFFVIGNSSILWAQQYLDSSVVALLMCSQPLFIALMNHLVDRTRMSIILFIGIALGTGGIALLHGMEQDHSNVSLYWFLLLAGSFAGALGAILSRRLDIPPSPWWNSCIQMMTASLVSGMILLATGEYAKFSPSSIKAEGWYAFIYLVLFGSIIAYTAFNYLCHQVSANAVATHSFVNPLVAIGLGLLLGEKILSPELLIPSALLIGAVILMWYLESVKSKNS
ncbi:MAG: EamA family transporter [Cytophagaceae bacterium]|nr:EamA family transporter [Cytophagaceae bacterium]